MFDLEANSRARFLALVAYAVAIYFCAASFGFAQVSQTLVKLGDGPNGSVYQWTFSFDAAYWQPGGGGYGTTAPSGIIISKFNNANPNPTFVNLVFLGDYGNSSVALTGSQSDSQTWTIPVGETWTYRYTLRNQYAGWPAGQESTMTSAAGTYVPPAMKQIAWAVPANTTENPMNWAVFDSEGNLVASVVQEAGDAATFLTATDLPVDAVTGDYQLKFWMTGLGFNAGSGQWIVAADSTELPDTPDTGGSEAVFVATTATPTAANLVNTGTTVTAGNAIAVTAPTMVPAGKIVPAGTGGAIWTSGGGTGGVSDAVFKEGVDKLFSQGVGTAKVSTGVLGAKGLGDAATSASGAQGTAAKASAESLYGSRPTSLGYSLSSSGEPSLVLAMPIAFGGATFDLNPFQSARLKGVTDWFRVGMAWLTLATLGVWVWTQLSEWTRGLSMIQQAKGNAVIGGTGAQATALVAAGLITTAIVVATTAMVGWAFGDINIPSLVATTTTNPLATMSAGAFWMLDQVFPVATMVAALVARMTFQMFAATLFAGCAAVIRFVVP